MYIYIYRLKGVGLVLNQGIFCGDYVGMLFPYSPRTTSRSDLFVFPRVGISSSANMVLGQVASFLKVTAKALLSSPDNNST